RGRAGVGVVASEDECARPGLAQRAGAGDGGGERERVGEVGDDLAVVGDGGSVDRTGKAADAEVERAAGADRRRAGGGDHAAVGNGERSDPVAAPTGGAERERNQTIPDR